jgi:hypothetical protein
VPLVADLTPLGPDLRELQARAEAAATAGAPTFALPEAAPVAALNAATGLAAEAAAWQAHAGYHALVRLCARALLALPAGDPVYVPKVAGELEPMLALWPGALVVPTTGALSPAALILLRAFPVHPLGVNADVAWADGRWCSPAEYFFHDLDHARYKLRADLALEGCALPDPYQEGGTLDPRTGQHRLILSLARGQVGGLWRRAPQRLALAQRLLDVAAALPGPQAPAGELLLFEILHEKSHALDRGVLAGELVNPAHQDKIARKHADGFYGETPPTPATIAALPAAGAALCEALA